MRARILSSFIAFMFCLTMPLLARTSADYTITPETADAAGKRSTSANYTIDNSCGAIGALNTSTNNTGKNGYIGQLYDVTALVIGASPTTVTETASRQLSALQVLDDATIITVNASSVGWSVLSGPITSISIGGLATAGNVFQDTLASVEGSFQGRTSSLGLTVVNVGTDDFGSYAGDGLDDAWQVQYFGQNNPNAAPNADPDGDGQNNTFEFTAGLVPTDPTSRFVLSILSVNGQPAQKRLVFNPLVSGRTYTPQFTSTVVSPSSWATLTNTSQIDNGDQRTVTDLNAIPRKFYRVQITKP